MRPTYRVQSSSDRSKLPGYTLLEVLVVLSIAALLAAALPLVGGSWLESLRLHKAGEQLVHEVYSVRHRAMTRGDVISLTYEDLRDRAREARLDYMNYGLTVSDAIVFYPNGAASGGRISISHEQESVVIEIDGVVGAIHTSDQTHD